MKQRQLTNWEATRIGFFLSAGVAGLLLIIWPASRNFTIFATNAIIIVFLFGIIGALFGKYLSRTRTGAWLGAAFLILLLFSWLYKIASTSPID
jgi:uncharacterized membrane protein YfcA